MKMPGRKTQEGVYDCGWGTDTIRVVVAWERGVSIMSHQDYLTRRWFFKECGVGLGTIALHALLHDRAGAACGGGALNPGVNTPGSPVDPMEPRAPHFPAR